MVPPSALPVAFLTTAGAFVTLLGVDVWRRYSREHGGTGDVIDAFGSGNALFDYALMYVFLHLCTSCSIDKMEKGQINGSGLAKDLQRKQANTGTDAAHTSGASHHSQGHRKSSRSQDIPKVKIDRTSSSNLLRVSFPWSMFLSKAKNVSAEVRKKTTTKC